MEPPQHNYWSLYPSKAHGPQAMSPCAATTESCVPWSRQVATTESCVPWSQQVATTDPVLQLLKALHPEPVLKQDSQHSKKPVQLDWEAPVLPTQRKPACSNKGSVQPKIKHKAVWICQKKINKQKAKLKQADKNKDSFISKPPPLQAFVKIFVRIKESQRFKKTVRKEYKKIICKLNHISIEYSTST